LTFAFLFHWAGPNLLRQMSSWWRIFHLLLILPLALMLIASLAGAAIDVHSTVLEGTHATVTALGSQPDGLDLGSCTLGLHVWR